METQQATFAGGCFWCTEAIFARLPGVASVIPGYTGGDTENPSYEDVSTGDTGHAEAVQITFDPDQTSYEELLRTFFDTHDPTQVNRQGADVGTQYRSAVFYHSQQQRETAEHVMNELESSGAYEDPIATELQQFETFYPAEEYHREFYERNPNHPYSKAVIEPKLDKLK